MEPTGENSEATPPARVGRGRRLTPYPIKPQSTVALPAGPASGKSEATIPPPRVGKGRRLSPYPSQRSLMALTLPLTTGPERGRSEAAATTPPPPARVGREAAATPAPPPARVGRERRLTPYPVKPRGRRVTFACDQASASLSAAVPRQPTRAAGSNTAPQRPPRRRRVQFYVAMPVDRDLEPDSDNESESGLYSDEEAAGRCETQAARDSGYCSGIRARTTSSSRNGISSCDDEREIDPAAAACIAQARAAFARHNAWHEQSHGNGGRSRSRSRSRPPVAPAPRPVVVHFSRMSTLGTRQERKKPHRLWAWLKRGKSTSAKKAAPKNVRQPKTTAASTTASTTAPTTAPTTTARTTRAMQPRVVAPSPPPPRPRRRSDTLRQYIDRRLGGGALEHSWIGGRDSYGRYPPLSDLYE